MLFYVNLDPFLIREHFFLFVILMAWTLFWKAYGVWIAVKNDHKGWFIALVILNTLGVLEIIYIFGVAKKKWSDVKRVFLKVVSLGK
ncbi:DUF5652 family protein [Candidatus Nomurabacteria bacterium]|nr:DUF5652 family protein [Candidatus Nomurabacteria bacterium]